METAVRAAYRPRDAAGSPLYRSVLDHLETYLAVRSRDKGDPAGPAAEDSLRSFLQCGIPRFGVARFRCKDCGDSRFVPFSCKRRMACPSCDAKRAVVESGRALDDLLADVPHRQWVFVLPKRLRYFVNRDPRLSGEMASKGGYAVRTGGRSAEMRPRNSYFVVVMSPSHRCRLRGASRARRYFVRPGGACAILP